MKAAVEKAAKEGIESGDAEKIKGAISDLSVFNEAQRRCREMITTAAVLNKDALTNQGPLCKDLEVQTKIGGETPKIVGVANVIDRAVHALAANIGPYKAVRDEDGGGVESLEKNPDPALAPLNKVFERLEKKTSDYVVLLKF